MCNELHITDQMMKEFHWTDEIVAEYSLASQTLTLWDFKRKKIAERKQPKPDWKIVEYRHIQLDLLIDNTSKHWEDAITNPEYEIYLVKRLSDEELFSIGDKVCMTKSSPTFDIIREIKLGNFQFGLDSPPAPYFSTENKSFGCYIDMIHHFNEPLFTTEDGKPIYKGDKYHAVNPEAMDLIENTTCAGNYYVRFVDIEAARTYIIMNKPILNLNEVKEIGKINDDNLYFKRLIEAAKDKLNKNE